MPFVTAGDGTELYVKDWSVGPGSTGTPVVLVHGWPLNADMWEHQAMALADAGHRVISYDRRGFGRSAQPWGGYDYDTLAADLHAVMEKLDLRGAALVGFSMGGGEVVRYLSRYGAARVSRAVLVSTVAPYMLKTDTNPNGVPEAQFDAIVAGLSKDRPAFLAEFAKSFYGRTMVKHTVSEPWLQWTAGMAFQASPRATMACVRAFGTTDFRADCKVITVPTLVIHGSSDATVPVAATGREAAKLIAGATYLEYDGEPHGLFATAGDRLNGDLLAFLGGSREPITPPALT